MQDNGFDPSGRLSIKLVHSITWGRPANGWIPAPELWVAAVVSDQTILQPSAVGFGTISAVLATLRSRSRLISYELPFSGVKG